MTRQSFHSARLPAYHENLLIVRMRESAAAATATTMTVALTPSSTPGLSTLAMMERAGLVSRIVPLRRPRELAAPAFMARPAVAMLDAPHPATDQRDPNAGVNIIELSRRANAAELQAALAADPHVESVSRVPARYLCIPSPKSGRSGVKPAAVAERLPVPAAVPPPAHTLWNLAKVRWQEARSHPGYREPREIRVAVLDTGIDRDHPDLVGRVGDYVYLHPDNPGVSSSRDIVGHGTHVAGTIAAIAGNSIGINGLCHCEILAWKIFDDQSQWFHNYGCFLYEVEPAMYRRALADCVTRGVDVINLSIGGPGRPDQQEALLFETLVRNGTVVVAAMGNDRESNSPISFPAAIPGVIAVGATSLDDDVATFSNAGNHIALAAPGVGIWSTVPTYPGQFGFEGSIGPDGTPREGKPMRRDTDYEAMDGTSMASPHVAGAAAMLLQTRGKTDPAKVRERLQRTADRVPGMHGDAFHPDYGAGRLNLDRLLWEP